MKPSPNCSACAPRLLGSEPSGCEHASLQGLRSRRLSSWVESKEAGGQEMGKGGGGRVVVGR